jgi:hypothetical protein
MRIGMIPRRDFFRKKKRYKEIPYAAITLCALVVKSQKFSVLLYHTAQVLSSLDIRNIFTYISTPVWVTDTYRYPVYSHNAIYSRGMNLAVRFCGMNLAGHNISVLNLSVMNLSVLIHFSVARFLQ